MAALHDGEKFLIQKYAIATIPSFTLTQAELIKLRNLRVLALGLSEEAIINEQPFPKLENVDKEIEEVTRHIPGSLPLRNKDFTRERIKTELSKQVYPIIHIATHGQFGIRPEDTFIVTGGKSKNDKKNNEKLTFKDLDILIRRFTRNTEPLELLALTACETAVGDNRSALGLGGVAIQAGAKSALASLWTISDSATASIAADFYANLQNESYLSKAEALQIVQKNIIEDTKIADKYKHPYYWSAIVLIGNWL
jgi:CHAT domain-containing protein